MAQIDIPPLDAASGATATEQVFETLYRAVVTLDLEPGAKVSEAEIANRLGVSRQPVRDAFFRLSKLGFLLIRPQRATRVTKISGASVRRATFIRTALEIACVRAAAKSRTENDLKALAELLEQQRVSVTNPSVQIFNDIDEAFHQRICEAAQHDYVWPLIEEQKAHMDRVRVLSLSFRRAGVCDEHEAILSALRDRDGDRAAAELSRHLGHIDLVIAKVRGEKQEFFEDEEEPKNAAGKL